MNNSKVKFFSSKVFSKTKIIHGFFTRNGGKSNKPFDSLNCSFSSGDDNLNVIENINIAKQKLKLKHTEMKFLTQIHGTQVELIDNRNLNEETVADGSITQKKDISLAILIHLSSVGPCSSSVLTESIPTLRGGCGFIKDIKQSPD